MRYLELIQRLDELKIKDCDLEDCEITANRIKNISFLIIKNKEGKVVECIILSDRRFEAPNVSYEVPNVSYEAKDECIYEWK